jgi:hypothetical protein
MLHRTDISPKLLKDVYESIFGSKYRKKVSVEDFIRFRMSDENPQPAFAYVQQLNALDSYDLCEDVKKYQLQQLLLQVMKISSFHLKIPCG